MASLINVRLNRGDASPWGFRLQGGKDFGTPLLIQKVNGSSLAEKGGLQVGDAVIRVNGTDVFNLRHKDAQDIIVRGGNSIEITVQRGGNATWKPAITPVGSAPSPSAHLPSKPAPVTKVSLAANQPPRSPSNIGSAHNLAPRPFSNPQVNGDPVKSIVNKQYNSPVNMYSEETIAETLSAQAEVLAGGVLGVNFKKNEKGYNAEKSEVFKMVQEAEREPRSPEPVEGGVEQGGVVVPPPIVGLRHVSAPEAKPAPPAAAPTGGSAAPGQNLCAECERLIVGVFVRIKDKNLHVECFKCATCGTSLKNVGYYNINNKLYCDIHAKMVARRNPPAPNLDPVTVPPGSRAPAGTISAALSNVPSAGPQSPSTIAPVPFHQSSPAAAAPGPKPFGSVSAPAPFTPPAAPPAPTAPFYTKQQPALPPSIKFVWPPKDDILPAATATPIYIPPPGISDTAAPAEKLSPEEPPNFDNPPCCIDPSKRMSICSEEVCEFSELKKRDAKSDNLASLTEESGDRPESPVPFGTLESADNTPKQEFQSFDVSAQNLTVDENTSSVGTTQNISAESFKASGQQGSASSQKVETTEDGGVVTTRRTKVEESFSHSSASYSSVRSSKTISRCITPEICEIMEKPRGSPSLLEMDRPTTPQQTVVFPPEIPTFVPLPRSRAGTPQPHALQRILSEEFGVKPQQPPVPIEEMKAQQAESLKSSEEFYTKSEVDEIVKKEIQKFKVEEAKFSSTAVVEEKTTPPEVHTNHQQIVESISQLLTEQNTGAESLTITQYGSNETEQSAVMENVEVSNISSNIIKTETEQQADSEFTPPKPDQATFVLAKKGERPFSPVQPPLAIIRPKPQPVPLPPETKPYYPPPHTEVDAAEKPRRLGRAEACQSPMVSALTTAPNRPYSPLPVPVFKPITLDDLPPPPEGEPMSLLAALTIAPDLPYTPFPEPVNVLKQSPPKFLQQSSTNEVKPSVPKPIVPVTTASVPSSTKETDTFSTCARKDSAFKPVQKPVLQSQPLPLPLPETVKTGQSLSSKAFPPVSNELKSTFSSKTTQQSVQNVSVANTQSQGRSDLLPYYQQNIGEIPLAHRPKSPVPHAIKAPMLPGAIAETPKRTVSEQIKCSASFVNSSSYMSSSAYGQTFTSGKQAQNSESSENLLPYYQQNIGEIPLAHRPKSPVPHPIKAPSTEPVRPLSRPSSASIKPSPLAGKAPELTKSKQVFKPETPYQNVFAAPPEPKKVLAKTLPHFSQPPSSVDQFSSGAPWAVKKPTVTTSQPKLPTSQPDFKSGAVSSLPSSQSSLKPSAAFSQLPSSKTNQKPAAGFTPPSQNIPTGPPTTSIPPAGAGGPGNKGATFAGSTAPRRGRGTLNPSVGPGARIPLCGSCNKQIRGPFITALGKIWCPEHFICANAQCRRQLQDIGFVEESTGLYCEYCFEQYLAPDCNKCSSKIKGDCLNAIGKHFHPECFCCAYCGKLFGNNPFFLEDALPYCESDWKELFTTKCFSCGFPIEAGDRWVEALSNNYHSQCFKCTMCKTNLEGQSFYAKGGRPFCKNHAR